MQNTQAGNSVPIQIDKHNGNCLYICEDYLSCLFYRRKIEVGVRYRKL